MIAFVYKPRRKTNTGRMTPARLYRARFRLEGDYKITDVSLETSDKQVAEKKLRELIKEAEQERAGIIVPKLERNSARRPIEEHLSDFLADMRVKNRLERYRKELSSRIRRVCKKCKWKFPADATADSFVSWRASQTDKAPKTQNIYLDSF